YSSSGPVRFSPSIGPHRCWSSSRARCTFRLCSSTPVSSMVLRVCASWVSSTQNTITDRRSSRNEPNMSPTTIKDLFASDIERNIEEVIKVDQTDEQIIREELAEYVATDSIRSHFHTILDRFAETPNKPHEG